MKILQVIIAFYPCKIWGGPPQNTLVLSKGLRSRGHNVEILTTNILDRNNYMSKKSVTNTWQGIPVTYLRAFWWGQRPNSVGFIVAPSIWKYRHMIKDADIIHIQGYREFLFVCSSLLSILFHKPYIVQARGSLPSILGRSSIKHIFDKTLGRIFLKNAAHCIALNDSEVSEYRKYGVSPLNITKILNPWDSSLYTQIPDGSRFRKRYGISKTDKIILFLSRIHYKKGLDLLIKSFAKLTDKHTWLCIVGPDDGFLKEAKRLINDFELDDKTIFTGPLYDEDKFDAYRAADIYVLPTRGIEGLPTTVIEACYAGTPIIVTRTTEVAEIVNNQIGIAVDYDINSMRDAIEGILNDPAAQEKFKNNTTNVLSRYFSLDDALDKFEHIYETCISEKY